MNRVNGLKLRGALLRGCTTTAVLVITLLMTTTLVEATGTKLVPFKATSTATQVIALDLARCPGLVVLVHGQGFGTHVGDFTTAQTHCVNPTGSDPLAFTDGVFAFTAANGDRLTGSYSGHLLPTSTPGLFALDGVASFEGGTGRFNHATGTAKATGLLNLDSGEAALFLEGIIGKIR